MPGRKFLNSIDPSSGVVLTVAGIKPDTNGNVPGAGDGYATDVALTDTANTTTTGVDTNLAIPAGLTPGTYEIKGVILATSAATNTGAQFAITAAAGATPAVRWANPSSATALAIQLDRAGGTWHATTGSPYAGGAPWPVFLDGAITVTVTTTTPITVQVRSEIGASEVSVKAGSWLSWRKILNSDGTAANGLLPDAFYTGDPA